MLGLPVLSPPSLPPIHVLTIKAIYSVANIEPKYAAVNGSLPSEHRCLM